MRSEGVTTLLSSGAPVGAVRSEGRYGAGSVHEAVILRGLGCLVVKCSMSALPHFIGAAAEVRAVRPVHVVAPQYSLCLPACSA